MQGFILRWSIHKKERQIIKLYDNYYIDVDSYQYILGTLCESVDKKTGQIVRSLRNTTYHSSLQQAINTFLKIQQRKLVDEKELTLFQTIEEFDKLQQSFEELLTKLIKEDLKEIK